jgi:hypothetical protein
MDQQHTRRSMGKRGSTRFWKNHLIYLGVLLLSVPHDGRTIHVLVVLNIIHGARL